MENQNRYCCRCHRTTRFRVEGTVYTCSSCGVVIDTADRQRPRTLIGNPLRSYKTTHAA